MKTIIYKIRANRYECADVLDGGGDDLSFIFELPISCRMTISGTVIEIEGGIGKAKLSSIPEGYVTPKLFLGGKVHTLEGFTVSRGAVIKKRADEEYIRNLSEFCEGLSKRVEALEIKNAELINLMTQKIKL